MDHLPPEPHSSPGSGSLRSQSPVIAQVSTIFFLNMLSRIALGPLMPTIENDLHIGHAEAGLFFLSISAGYTIILVAAGFITSRIKHRLAIVISALGVGLSLIGVALSGQAWSIRLSLFFLGLTTGLYLPSGVATLTSVVNPKHWGKALSIHQLSPNLAYFLAPLLVELTAGRINWRELLGLYGLCSLTMGLFFLLRGQGGEFKSDPPTPAHFKVLYANPNIWILIVLFSLAIGNNQGLFGMMALYLINSRELDPTWANHLIAIARIAALAMPLLGGCMADRIGVRPVMKILILVSGSINPGPVPGPALPAAPGGHSPGHGRSLLLSPGVHRPVRTDPAQRP